MVTCALLVLTDHWVGLASHSQPLALVASAFFCLGLKPQLWPVCSGPSSVSQTWHAAPSPLGTPLGQRLGSTECLAGPDWPWLLLLAPFLAQQLFLIFLEQAGSFPRVRTLHWLLSVPGRLLPRQCLAPCSPLRCHLGAFAVPTRCPCSPQLLLLSGSPCWKGGARAHAENVPGTERALSQLLLNAQREWGEEAGSPSEEQGPGDRLGPGQWRDYSEMKGE